jgi:uncharacterized membrane protein YphA (DoxX/SURF4 family)
MYREAGKRWGEASNPGEQMKTRAIWRFVCGLGRIAAGAAFIGAGLGKIDNASVVVGLRRFVASVVPFDWALNVGSVQYVPALELGLGVFLICGLFTRIHAVVGIVVLMVFSGLLTMGWAKGVELTSCYCFGSGSAATSYPLLICRDLGMALLLLPAAWKGGGRLSLDYAFDKWAGAGVLKGRGLWRWAIPVVPLVLCFGLVSIRQGMLRAELVSLEAQRDRLEVEVKDSSGKPLKGCNVLVEPFGSGEPDQALGHTDHEGRLVADVRPCGVRFLVIDAPSGRGELKGRRLILPSVESGGPGQSVYRLTVSLKARGPGEDG